jgi:pyruvate,water dikinase
MPEFIIETPARCRQLRRAIAETVDAPALVALWEQEIKPAIYEAFTMLRGSMKWFDGPAAKLRHELVDLVGPADAHMLLSDISGGKESLDSMGPVLGIAQVARGELTRQDYLDRYGHRSPHEWELLVPDPAEEPTWLDRRLAEYRENPVDIKELLGKKQRAFQAAWERFGKVNPKKADSIGKRIATYSGQARQREAVRSEATRVGRLGRDFGLRAGELTDLGENVFFLSLGEMADCLRGEQEAAARVAVRRETYERYCNLPPYPSIINGRFDPFTWAADPNRRSDLYDAHAPAATTAADQISGFPGAAGRVEGVVRVLEGMEQSEQFRPGEILVAVTTNVGWTPLFPRAAAIVTDVGAPLSHAAIVARELGLPAVVGCGDATAQLRTGDRVLVDGAQGLVRILERA